MKHTEDQEQKEEKKEVCCLSCKKTVQVELVPYGGGYAGICSECNELAYLGR